MSGEKRGTPASLNLEKIQYKSHEYMDIEENDKMIDKPSVLLHSCCGPCSTSVIERLLENYNVTIYFYNPNITDKDEYIKRRDAQKDFIKRFNESNKEKIGMEEGPYDVDEFYKKVAGLENEQEGGRRCVLCFELRLEKTAQSASIMGYDAFATTLTVSPHKDHEVIGDIGKRMSVRYSVDFLNIDFKKKAGFMRSIELSKKYNLYRQNYCGCKFSKEEKTIKEKG